MIDFVIWGGIIAGVFGFLLSLVVYGEDKNYRQAHDFDKPKWLFARTVAQGIFWGVIIGFVGGFAVGLIADAADPSENPEYKVTYPLKETKLTTEKDATGWYIFIAGGYDEDEELVYRFYVEHPKNGTVRLEEIDADRAVFKETTGPARIVCWTRDPGARTESYSPTDYDLTRCKIRVPEGTISNDIDLKIPS